MSARTVGITTSVLLGVYLMACGGSSRTEFDTSATQPTDDAGGVFGDRQKCASEGDPEADSDQDGYPAKLDCNDCDPNVNNGALDIPGNGIDDDCNGEIDDDGSDDSGIAVDTTDPYEGARAMGLWKRSDPERKDWGVIEAAWVMPDGKKLKKLEGVGVLPSLGVISPPAGSSMLILSSGSARDPSDPDYEDTADHGYSSGTPAGYPKESPSCSGSGSGFFDDNEANDGASLHVKIRVPTNVKSFTYQQYFFTKEYPSFICKSYNDFFVAMMDPAPEGLDDGNIAFDQDKNPISVNNSLLQVCVPDPKTAPKEFECPLGNADLQGTGFEDHGATGWLTTTAPVKPGSEIELTFSIWDAADGIYDSTVLLDDFRFSLADAAGAKTTPTR